MQIPTTKQLSDAERFCEGLRLLMSECNLVSTKYNGFGMTQFTFEDGSWMGGLRAFMNAGWIDEEIWNKQYGKYCVCK